MNPQSLWIVLQMLDIYYIVMTYENENVMSGRFNQSSTMIKPMHNNYVP